MLAAAPGAPGALEREVRTGPVSGTPLVVAPLPTGQVWIDAGTTFDLAPVSMTLSDGGRWHGRAATSRLAFAAGLAVGSFAAAAEAGVGTGALAAQVDVLRDEKRRLGITAAGRLVYGGGWDVSATPSYGAHLASYRWGALVAFGAARLRFGRTLYDVQGWSADRASPYATAITRDLALAPMAGVALGWRYAELRATAGWEVLLLDRTEREDRPTALSRSGGPFALLQLRARFGSPAP